MQEAVTADIWVTENSFHQEHQVNLSWPIDGVIVTTWSNKKDKRYFPCCLMDVAGHVFQGTTWSGALNENIVQNH